MSSSPDVPRILPRVLIVSCHDKRFIGECHLDGVVPIVVPVPRVSGVHAMLDSLEPIHGVLLCVGEGEGRDDDLSPEQLEAVHPSDAAGQDSMELLARFCLERDIPFLGIHGGSQVLNVACGGSLYKHVEHELMHAAAIRHIDHVNYDEHRHQVRVLPGTPLHDWFAESLDNNHVMMVNSYHRQGVRRLAERFVPMALAPDGLVEGFYDPGAYSPGEGRFVMGLQFQPERMRKADGDGFDYPGCAKVYREFVRAGGRLPGEEAAERALVAPDARGGAGARIPYSWASRSRTAASWRGAPASWPCSSSGSRRSGCGLLARTAETRRRSLLRRLQQRQQQDSSLLFHKGCLSKGSFDFDVE